MRSTGSWWGAPRSSSPTGSPPSAKRTASSSWITGRSSRPGPTRTSWPKVASTRASIASRWRSPATRRRPRWGRPATPRWGGEGVTGPGARRRRLVVFGLVGQSPFAGVAWQGLHYLEGLRRLGYDVFYVEDTQEWPYDPEQDTKTDDLRFTLRYLERLMTWAGLGDRWAYRSAVRGDAVFGPAAPQFHDLVGSADGLINLTGTTVLREEYLRGPVRIYLETDPVQPQIDVAEGRFIERLASHTHHFTFGENVGAPDCGVPVGRFQYRPTRQPVVLDWWDGPAAGGSGRTASEPAAFTTVANWRQSGK